MHGIVYFAALTAAMFVPLLRAWPLLWVVPLAAYLAAVAVVEPLRVSFVRWQVGRATPFTLGATVLIAIVSCGTLAAFHYFAQPDISVYSKLFPVRALGGILITGIVFSVLNATFEELVFRGVLYDALESQWGGWGAVVSTAAMFGYGHLRGYPPGASGAVLAGIYGLALGWLRMRTGGLGLPIATHIAADATIFAIVARSGSLS